jgi:anti-sigma B factor antagonist
MPIADQVDQVDQADQVGVDRFKGFEGLKGFEARIERRGGSCTVRLLGELDLATVQEARDALDRARGSDAGSILVDIQELRFIDSTGLALLLEAVRRNGEAHRVRFTRGTGRVTELLRLTGLDEELPFA